MRIESRLRFLASEDPYAGRLLAQWVFDKELVGRALLGTVQSFPHYSLHDRSHSETILDRMSSLLGPKRVEKIGATDAWLLLESAYWHDIGMLIVEEEARKWMSGDRSFSEYLRSLALDPSHELHSHVLRIEQRRELDGLDSLLDLRRSLVLVLAEYVRRQHASRADGFVRSPESIQLQSPRNTLLPRRLWDLLGKICDSHGQRYENVLLLPRTELGLGIDEAHPRFIACMLRLGDLLDLDDGRFCPSLGMTFQLPASSLLHKEKHASIRHLHICPERIEVEAYCGKDFDVYKTVDDWLTLLRNELREQATHWLDITPTSDFGAIPSDGGIRASMEDEIHIGLPKFSIDSDAALELFRGSGLYDDPSKVFMREVLQNAMDATILRAFREKRDDYILADHRKAEKELLAEYPVTVMFEEIAGTHDDEQVNWKITVRDSGRGILRSDLQYMRAIGSSRYNPRRAGLVADMPEWLRPSGFFGLGMQSIFYVADEFLIRTRHHESMELLSLRAVRERGAHESGRLVVQDVSKQDASENRKWFSPGTEVVVILKIDRIPRTVRAMGGAVGAEILRSFDGLIDRDFPAKVAELCDYTVSLAKTLPCLMDVFWKPLNGECISYRVSADDAPIEAASIDTVTSISLSFDRFSEGGDTSFRFLYRGVPLELEERRLSNISASGFIGGICDIRAGVASDYLGASREKLSKNAEKDVDARFWASYCHELSEFLTKLRLAAGRANSVSVINLQEQLRSASLAAKLILEDKSKIADIVSGVQRFKKSQLASLTERLSNDFLQLAASVGEEWKKVEISNNTSLGDIAEWDSIYIWNMLSRDKGIGVYTVISPNNPVVDGQDGAIRIQHPFEDVLTTLFSNISFVGTLPLEDAGNSLFSTSAMRRLQEGIVRRLDNKVSVSVLDDNGLRFIVEQSFSPSVWGLAVATEGSKPWVPRPGVGRRWTILCSSDFSELSVDKVPPWSMPLTGGLNLKLNKKKPPMMLFPFSPTEETIDVVELKRQIEWVVANSLVQSSWTEVCDALERLIVKIHGWWDKESQAFQRSYDIEEVRARLHALSRNARG